MGFDRFEGKRLLHISVATGLCFLGLGACGETILCPTNRIVAVGANCTAPVPDLRPEIVVADPLAVSGIAQAPLPGELKHLGTVPVKLSITYTNGSTEMCHVLLNVVDLTPPAISPMEDKVVEHTAPWTFDYPQALDACDSVTLSIIETRTNRTCGPAYVATRAWRAVDGYANSTTCTQQVSVVDSVPPMLSVSPDFTVECSSTWTFGIPLAADKGLNPACVFDNSVNDLAARFELDTNEIGNEIILSGTERYIQGFSFEFWSTNITGSDFFEGPEVMVRLRFYANDGPLFNGYRTPGTLLYDSGEFWLGPWTSPRATVVYDAFDLGVLGSHPLTGPVPPSFTWTVQFSGLGSNDRAGLDIYSPPTVGIGYGDFWMLTDTGWKLREYAGLEVNFAARALASSNTVDIQVAATMTNHVTANTFTATRTWRATDLCGNSTEQTQTVSVIDTVAPLITHAPENQSATADTNCVALIPDLRSDLQASDVCGGQVIISQEPPVGAEVGLGPHIITLSASDEVTNVTTCSVLFTVEAPPNPSTQVVISEFVAKNTTYPDEDGAFSDWVELWNQGRCPVDLQGWYLTDKTNQLTQWQFPATNIAPGQYLVVWLSGKNKREPGAPLHSNFSLKDEGEYLALTRPDGVTVVSDFYPVYPPQLPNVSYGIPDGNGTNTYLATATPGAANSVSTNFPVIPLVFSPTRGWYSNAISVTIQATSSVPNLKIYYTTNGSIPAPGNGQLYTGPIPLANTTPLRAAAYALGYQPQVTTHSYIYPEKAVDQTGEGLPETWGSYFYVPAPVPAQYRFNESLLSEPRWSNQVPAALRSVPSISIAMSIEDMFGTNGIYANSILSGDEWERPCSAEYFLPGSTNQFQSNCGIQIQGDYSTIPDVTPKHNFRLLFKQKFGSGKLVHDVYPGSSVREFDTLVLHASCNDHWVYFGPRAQMQRDQWCADTQREAGGYGAHGTYVNLYINGLYWGLYNMGERPDAAHAARYLGGQKSDYDTYNAWELKDGTDEARDQLIALVRAGITNEAAYSNACRYLNVPHFIDYLLINFYAGTTDWPENNYWLCGSVLGTGIPFHFFVWDAEFSFHREVTLDRTGINFADIGEIYASLCNWPEFRLIFGDRAQGMLFNRGLLTSESSRARWMRRAEEIRLGIIAESARWGITNKTTGVALTQGDWLHEQEYLLTNWFPRRTEILISQLRARDLYPSLDAPVFSPHGGLISGTLNVVVTAPPDATVYYTTDGTDPRGMAGTASGGAFVLPAGSAAIVPITAGTHLSARSFLGNTWSALTAADYVPADEAELRIVFVQRRTSTTTLHCTAWPGASYSLLSSANILSGWEVLAQVTPFPDGTLRYVDPSASNHIQRFYMLRWP